MHPASTTRQGGLTRSSLSGRRLAPAAGTHLPRTLTLLALLGCARSSAEYGARDEVRAAGVVPQAAAAAEGDLRRPSGPSNTESYAVINDNPFLAARTNPLSTFSIDVDRAAYSNVRRFVTRGERPPKDAVRIEELVNYFPYDYPEPSGADPLAITTEVADAPWNPAHALVRIGIKGKSVDMRAAPPNNLVFLLDVSGSMESPDKLPLLKHAFRLLVNELREQDRVAIVVYAGSAGLVLPSTSGDQKPTILDAIAALEAGGSTAGGEGIRLAYKVAREHHRPGTNSRVILATDGDFNVGASSDAEMVRLIEAEREHGVFLTTLGFGTGNYKDSKLEQLADQGNGNYAYVDTPLEARKVLVAEMGGTLLTIAKDVKLQVEFNPARAAAYRLIGYENRLLAAEDFNDDTKDAGELGAGHTVTALYEVVPVGARTAPPVRGVDPLKYQAPASATSAAAGPELLTVKLRYKNPEGAESRLLQHPVADRRAEPSADFTFAAAVAAYGMLLRDSEHKGSATFEDAIAMAERGLGADPAGYRREFVSLARRTADLGRVADDGDGGAEGEGGAGDRGDRMENSRAGETRHAPAPPK